MFLLLSLSKIDIISADVSIFNDLTIFSVLF